MSSLESCKCARMRFDCASDLVVLRSCVALTGTKSLAGILCWWVDITRKVYIFTLIDRSVFVRHIGSRHQLGLHSAFYSLTLTDTMFITCFCMTMTSCSCWCFVWSLSGIASVNQVAPTPWCVPTNDLCFVGWPCVTGHESKTNKFKLNKNTYLPKPPPRDADKHPQALFNYIHIDWWLVCLQVTSYAYISVAII